MRCWYSAAAVITQLMPSRLKCAGKNNSGGSGGGGAHIRSSNKRKTRPRTMLVRLSCGAL
jgi:hypothetical protein